MKLSVVCLFAVLAAAPALTAAARKPPAKPEQSEIDRYREETKRRVAAEGASPGAIWTPYSRLLDAGSDLRASRPGDLITILVREDASAVASGTVKTQRSSSAKANISSLAGISPPALAGLAGLGSEQNLAGDGETSRHNSLRASVTARVTELLPNGNMIVEGNKTITVNSETQIVTVRGVARPFDISTGNVLYSERLGLIEVKVNGKGVVNDAIRRPNFFYRLLLGLIPF